MTAGMRYALFGEAPAHSPWLRAHAAFARQTGIDACYETIPATPASFARQLDAFFAGGGIGANIAAPIEPLAAAQCRVLTVSADRAGMADTLVRQFDGSVLGDSTAGQAFLNDLGRRRRHDLRDRRTLLLGAGGAGLLPALIDAGVGDVAIAHRDDEPVAALAAGVGAPGQVNAVDWNDLPELGAFDLVIHGRCAALDGERFDLPLRLLAPRALAYDLGCGADAREFIAWAQAGDAEDAMDGLGMFVDRAAAAFQRWHGVTPDADAALESLRAELAC